MTILKTKADVDSLGELRRRKAELKAKLDAEQAEIKEVWHEVRSDLQPAHIIGRAVKSVLGISNQPENDVDEAALGWASRIKGP
jgi:predicted nuclease with TOPRIM domain